MAPEYARSDSIDVSEPGAASRIRREAAKFVQEHGGTDALAQDAETIVAEVLDNIREHASFGVETPPGRRPVEIRFEVAEGSLLIQFRDRAAPFDPVRHDPNTRDGDSYSGFGLRIVAELADELTYRRSAGRENVLSVRLTLRRTEE